MAVIATVAALGVIVGLALLGQRGDGPSGSGAAVEPPGTMRAPTPTAALTPARTRGSTAAATPAAAAATPTAPLQPDPVPDVAGALPGDDGVGPVPLGIIDRVPNADRLDFLFELCTPDCFRDAHWMDPTNPKVGSGAWSAGRPFHVREGFINDRTEPLGGGFDVVLYVTRLDGGPDEPTYRYTSDYVLRGPGDRCGPTYRTQTRPRTCEWFVHDFPEGLPEGRWAITARWLAPCWAWIDLGLLPVCPDPDEVISLFSSSFDAPYDGSGPVYTEVSS